jgi:hypothetical protein
VFGKAVNALAEKARNEAYAAEQVAIAIQQDARFAECWDAQGFELQFPQYYPDWLVAVELVSTPFYGWLNGDLYDAGTFGLSRDMCYKRIMDAFWEAYPRVCGYCDGAAGDKADDRQANDCEHFFPQSKWPHLALHPRNLYLACQGCNRTWKSTNAPMGDGGVQGLNDTYHPWLRPGVGHLTVAVKESPRNPQWVELMLSDKTITAQNRVVTLLNVLGLKSRWENYINTKFSNVSISTFVASLRRQKAKGLAFTTPDLKQEIDEEINRCFKLRDVSERVLAEEAMWRYQKAHRLAEILNDLN